MWIERIQKIEKFMMKEYKKELIKKEYEKNLDISYKNIEKDKETKAEYMKECLSNTIKKFKKKDINMILEFIDDFKEMNEDLIEIFSTIFINSLFHSFKIRSEEGRKMVRMDDIDNVINNLEEWLKKIKIWFVIHKEKNKKCFIDRRLIYKCIKGLIDKKIINDRNIKIGDKTHKTISIDGVSSKLEIEIYFEKFELQRTDLGLFIMTNHYSTIKEITRWNSLSKKKIHLSDEDIDMVEKLTKYSVLINIELLKKFLEKFKIEYSIEDDVEKNYAKIINELRKSINEKNEDKTSALGQRLSIIQRCLKMKYIIEKNIVNTRIFLPFWFDFRGRIYYGSDLSPTFSIEMRYCIYDGFYTKKEIENNYEENRIDSLVKKYIDKIKNIENMCDILKKINIKTKIGIIFVIMSIAECEKTNLGKKVNIEKFIDRGIDIINNSEKYNYDYEKQIKIYSLIDIINNIKNGVFKKGLISKDATASVFQLLVKFLGNKDKKSLEICNLYSEEYWFDTYQYIIDEFKKNIKNIYISQKELDMFFNRSTLKKTIMTEKYSCGRKKCLDYYLEIMSSEHKKIMEIEEKKKEVIKIFNKFYTYTSKNENITLNTTEKIREKFRKNKTLEFIGSTKIYLDYCKIVLKEIDGQIEKKRYTKIIRELGSEDEEKFEQAITANIIQAYDAYLVREILKWKNIITIHDCFLIDWQNTSELINRINIEMNKKFSNEEVMNEDIFSIFIVL